MRPNINVLENSIAVTREMNEEEYTEYLETLKMAEVSVNDATETDYQSALREMGVNV